MAAEIRTRVETFGFGFWVAIILVVAVWLGVAFGRFDLPLALTVSAICSIRL